VKVSAIRALFALVFSCAAFADQMQFESPGSNIWWTSAGPYAGVYISPYTALDVTTNKTLSIYCLDYNDEIAPPFNWDANLWQLKPGNLSHLQFGSMTQAYNLGDTAGTITSVLSSAPLTPGSYDRYLEAAWLFTRSAATSDPTAQTEFQVAAWSLFVNSGSVGAFIANINDSGTGFANAVYNDVNSAQFAVSHGWAGSGWSAVTMDPTWDQVHYGNVPVQEFLEYNATPEPSALILFGTIAAVLFCIVMRRKRLA